MGQVRQKAGQDQLLQIKTNVAQIRHEKDCLEVRQLAITRTLKQLEKQLNDTIDLEDERDTRGALDNLCAIGSDLESYRLRLEGELSKMNRGLRTLEEMKGKPGKKALEAYIIEDTKISVQSTKQIRGYYDQVMVAIKNIV